MVMQDNPKSEEFKKEDQENHQLQREATNLEDLFSKENEERRIKMEKEEEIMKKSAEK